MSANHNEDMINSSKWRILIIDDDEEDYLITKDMLKEAKGRKVEVHWASTFEQGQKELIANHYHAVLVDYDLGIHSGIELIREANEQGYPSPLILYTGRGNYEVDLEAMQAGATLYITKREANPLLLERVIRYAIELKEKEHSLRESETRLMEREAELRKRSTALYLSEEKFAKAFQASPVAIAISTAAEGRFIEVNDSYTALFGFSREELIGHTSVELGMFPNPEDRQKVARLFRSNNGFRDYELRLLTKSKSPRDVFFSTERIEIDNQECMLSLVVDISERKQAEQALIASEGRLREFLESTHDSFFILDQNWRFQYVNRRATEILGASADELIGKVYWEVFPRYIGTLVESHYLQAMKERVPVHYQQGGVYSPYWYDISVYPSGDGIAVFAADRTEEKKVQEALRQLSEAVKQSPASVVITDLTGKIEYVNPKFTQLTGFSFEESIGQNPRILKSEQTPGHIYQQMWETILSGRSWQGEFVNRKKNGELYWESASISPITTESGAITHFVAVKEDITERKQAQEALAESAKKLELSNRELEQFAFVASHDLQEPLRKIRMFGDRLSAQLKGDSSAEAKDYLTRMQNAAERMQKMVDGLLALSRVSTRSGTFTSINLKDIAEEAVSDLEARIHATGGQVMIAELPTIEADELQIRQLFQNIIGNALKFHRTDVPPVVQITGKTTENEKSSMAVVYIQDNGIGFKQQHAEWIFQPFQRLHEKTEYEGTGLGLAICKKIVERHQGKIEAQSTPGEGTTFIIQLPIRHA